MVDDFVFVETVNKPLVDVWRFLCTLENVPYWIAGNHEQLILEDMPPRKGITFQIQNRKFGRDDVSAAKIVRWLPFSRIAYISYGQDGICTRDIRCAEAPRGTLITLHTDFERGDDAGSWRSYFGKRKMKRTESARLKMLKHAIEKCP